jgi:hypothetical protein
MTLPQPHRSPTQNEDAHLTPSDTGFQPVRGTGVPPVQSRSPSACTRLSADHCIVTHHTQTNARRLSLTLQLPRPHL